MPAYDRVNAKFPFELTATKLESYFIWPVCQVMCKASKSK